MKNNIFKITILIIIILLYSMILSGCKNVAVEVKGLTEYKDSKNKDFVSYNGEMPIKLSYPKTWVNLKTEDEKQKSIYVSTDGTRTMLNLDSYETDLNIDELANEFKKDLEKNMDVIGETSIEMINLNGRRAYKIDYTLEVDEATLASIQSGGKETEPAKYKFFGVAFIDDKVAYTLTLTTPERNYQKNKNTIENIIKSFGK